MSSIKNSRQIESSFSVFAFISYTIATSSAKYVPLCFFFLIFGSRESACQHKHVEVGACNL